MAQIQYLGRATAEVVEQYVRSRRSASAAVSTRLALRAIRAALPNCDLTDRELADMVAASAVKHGRNVDFDLPPSVEQANARPLSEA